MRNGIRTQFHQIRIRFTEHKYQQLHYMQFFSLGVTSTPRRNNITAPDSQALEDDTEEESVDSLQSGRQEAVGHPNVGARKPRKDKRRREEQEREETAGQPDDDRGKRHCTGNG